MKNSDPRQESFVQMLHFSICPLLKKNSFTYWICIIDILHYLLQLAFQQTYLFTLRPHQKVLFHFGQLYPFYASKEFWRLVISLEQHKNEIHLAFSLLFKLHFFSFIEHMIGSKRTLILYILSGVSATLFQGIMNKQAGYFVYIYQCLWIISYRNNLLCLIIIITITAYFMQFNIEKCTPQQQLQFYFDHQSSQDFGNTLAKLGIVFTIMLVISMKFSGILMIGSVGFGIQCCLIGLHYQQEQKQQQQLQLINNVTQQKQFKYLYLAIGIVIIEMIVFLQFKKHVEI